MDLAQSSLSGGLGELLALHRLCWEVTGSHISGKNLLWHHGTGEDMGSWNGLDGE